MKVSLFKENIKIALGSIKGQLLRTILTVVIIGIGIMALVGILSGVSALENTISSDFSSMGANTFNIQRYEFNTQRQSSRERQKVNPVITYRNVKDFQDNYDFPFTKTSVSFIGTRAAEIKTDSDKTDPEVTVLGANEHFLENSGLEVEGGRGFNVFDITNNNAVCVIGSDLVKALFKDVNPVGKTISVRGSKFKVIGHLKEKGATFGNNQDLRVILPIQKARSIFTNPFINYNLSIKVDKKDMLEGAQDDAVLTFRNVRGLNPVEENDFGLERSEDLINRISNISSYLYVAAWIISIITIFGSTIALMNIMLVSVSERTREIGVRKALGAKSKTIAVQFFIETVVIGQLGALLGIVLGILIGWLLATVFELNFSTPWFAMFWGVTIAFIVAVVSGVYPATKAAKLDPIESLRYE
ncbi:putative ABC transport system permease protein [Winogradskyella wandonensis]|uniref:Putative ABC transport system permease protein n=1 Tax=Winogradskyella wandonensis TaxID=1442586 RepID=A0A4R1KIP9_9FLAO|nr:ABC transporter permease [Winogradskyella wandonensis]TCK64662.1 putative ABC transport system permease protein [Winogradskyella wandonensis]